ncbi:MAG: hypothetical protein ABI697_01400 [Devosia sp.]
MRLLLRILGTLLIAVAVILLVIDGSRSLAANALVITPLDATWGQIHPDSLAALRGFFATRLLGPVLEVVINTLLGLPGWAVIGVPGIVIAWAGRSRRERVYIHQDLI